MANVLIIGASRGIGLETVRAALRAGHSVRALARSAAGIPTASKDWRFGAISRADVADFLVRQVDDRTLIGTTPLLIS